MDKRNEGWEKVHHLISDPVRHVKSKIFPSSSNFRVYSRGQGYDRERSGLSWWAKSNKVSLRRC